MSYTARWHSFRIHKAKRDFTLLSSSDSDFNNGFKTRGDILRERPSLSLWLSQKPNLSLTLLRLLNTQHKQLTKETDF